MILNIDSGLFPGWSDPKVISAESFIMQIKHSHTMMATFTKDPAEKEADIALSTIVIKASSKA